MATKAVPPLTEPRNVVPETSRLSEYHAFNVKVTEPVANVVEVPPTSFLSSTVLLLRNAK